MYHHHYHQHFTVSSPLFEVEDIAMYFCLPTRCVDTSSTCSTSRLSRWQMDTYLKWIKVVMFNDLPVIMDIVLEIWFCDEVLFSANRDLPLRK